MSLGDANTVSYERLHIGFTGFNIYISVGSLLLEFEPANFCCKVGFRSP